MPSQGPRSGPAGSLILFFLLRADFLIQDPFYTGGWIQSWCQSRFPQQYFGYFLLLNVLLGFVLLLALAAFCLYNIVGGLVRGFLLCPMSFLLTIVQSAELETVLRLQTD